jgi:hypothetical protein
MTNGTETWMVAILPETGIKVSSIIAFAYGMHLPLRMKETCFGLLVESEPDAVKSFIEALKKRFEPNIFVKRRGFSISDTKICPSTFRYKKSGFEVRKGIELPMWFRRAVGCLLSLSHS